MSITIGSPPGPVYSLESDLPPDPALAGVPVDLAGRVEIFPTAPLPWLNAPHGKAYAARAKGETRSNLYAFICEEGLPVRGEAFANFMNCDTAGLVRFRDQGVVYWPLTDQMEQVVVLQRPAGPRFDQIYATPQQPLDDATLVQSFIKPMADVLMELAKRGLTHGNIHMGNLFYNTRLGEVQLGEAVSGPPSSAQPLLYTTIERGQAHPTGRGNPSSADDLYAIGMTGLIFALGFNPWSGMSEDELLRVKIERGSFFGLVGEQRLKGTLIELFRGLLDDSLRRRWDLNDLDTWLNGRRPAPRAADSDLKPSRPFTLNNVDYQTLRSTVHGMTREPMAAAAVIENGELERWLSRTLNSDRHASLLKKATTTFMASNRGSTFQDQLTARAAVVLDPQGPLRFRGVAVLPSGIGYALASLLIRGGNIQPIIDIIASPLPSMWVDEQYEGRGDHLQTQQQLEQARAYLERRTIGHGIERVIYEMLPAQPCLSPLIRKAQCRTVTDVLVALEKIAGDNVKREPLDRHIVAFMLSRERRINQALGNMLSAPEGTPDRAIGMVRLLAEAQARQGPADLPGLTAWAVHQLEPAIKRFHQKDLQDKARTDLQRLSKGGDLVKLVEAIDNPAMLAEDQKEFEIAQQMYATTVQDIEDLQMDIRDRTSVEGRVGQPIAAGVSAVVGFLAVGLVAMLSVMGIYL